MRPRPHPLRSGFFALLLVLSVVAGCSDLGAPLRLLPHLELSANSLEFGAVVVSGAVSLPVRIGNSGNADLHGVASLSCADFAIESGGGAYTVPPGGTHDVVVRYTPSGVGPSSCQLQLGDGLPTVALSGTGSPAPVGLAVPSVSSVDFGTIFVGTGQVRGFQVYSRGTAPVDVDVEPTCTDITLLAGGGPHHLPPGDSVSVAAQYVPGRPGPPSCTITTGAGNPVVSVTADVVSVSFARDIVPILSTEGCTGCHGWTRADQLVNVTTVGYSPAVIVAPGDLPNSVLYQKVANTHKFGATMPQGTLGLPAAMLLKVRYWILEGARDN